MQTPEKQIPEKQTPEKQIPDLQIPNLQDPDSGLRGLHAGLQSIDLLVPELFASDGGIQAYSRTLIRALQKLRPQMHMRVFILNDHPHHLPNSGWPGIAWFAAAGSRTRLVGSLLRAARQRRADVLVATHSHFAPLQWLHHQLSGTPSWCSAHGIEVWSLRPGWRCWCLAHLQRLLPVSRFTAEQLSRQLGEHCPPLAWLPNSFDPQRFSPGPRPNALVQRYQLETDQPLIFSLSRLSQSDRDKHLDRLIEAIPALLPQWPKLRLMIAGDGDDRPRLEALVQQLDLQRHVIFCGRLPEHELADHMRLASVFALPSSGEGFGIVFLEALGCGRPVLAGNQDGSCDPLADGRLGLLIDPDQPLAPALTSLLQGQGEDLWFQPQALAQAAMAAFGFEAFCRRLEAQLLTLESR